jgi:hypothetical protein
MATYYWVGGSGTWDGSATANWSASSGGAGGSGPPNNTDTVIFDSASGTGTCTTAAGSACATATLNSTTLDLTLGANHTMSGTFTLTLGALSLGTNTLTCNILSFSGSSTRSIDFGTGEINITGNDTTIIAASTVTNFSYAGTPTVNCTYAGSTGTRLIRFGNVSGHSAAIALDINITAGSDSVSPISGFKNLNFTGFSGTLTSPSGITIYGDLILSATTIVASVTSAIVFAAPTGTQQITTNGVTIDRPITHGSTGLAATLQLQDNLTMGSTRTFTLTSGTLDLSNGNRTLSTGLFSSSNSNTRAIAFGTGNVTVVGNGATVWTTSNMNGFTYTGTPTINCTYAGSTGTRTILTGNTSNGASETNVLNFNITAGADTVVLGTGVKNLNFTGFAGTASDNTRTVFGDLTLSSGMTLGAGTGVLTFAATSGTKQITTNGKTIDCPITFNGAGGTFEFQDALTQGSTRAFTVTNGTVQLKNSVTSTVGSFITSGTNQKFLQSTTPGSQATISQASGTVDVSYLTIQDSNATGGATWNAFVNQQNIDAGNNDGWDFGISPIVGSYEYTYQLRSFTQPRRF